MIAAGPPRLSVVIPTYCRPEQLAECLAALADADYDPEDFEVIVVDDGSPTSPDHVVGAVRDRLRIRLVRQENAGAATARNSGARVATGSHLAFIDDDCRPSRGWLSALSVRIAEQPDCCLGGRTLNALEHMAWSSASQLLVDYLYSYYNTDEPEFFASNNMCLPAEAFREMGGFDPSFSLIGGEDRDFCSRWVHQGRRLVFAPEAVIDHAHLLNLRGFLRQHFNYGRGAHSYHQRRAQRENRGLRVEPLGFYLDLLCYPFKRLGAFRAVLVLALLGLSQVANAAGFFYEVGVQRRWPWLLVCFLTKGPTRKGWQRFGRKFDP